MKLIKPSFEIWEQPAGLEGVYKQIEKVGRVSHKSEHNIKEGSAKDFVGRMLNMRHLSTCEFGTVYLYIDYHNPSFGKIIDKYNNNKYSKCIIDDLFPNKAYISSNYRVLVENNWLDDLKYLCEPTEYHEKRYAVKFICDRGILAEFTRHRGFSFMAESTRYCNYSKDKFNNELTFIQPVWTYHQEDGDYGTLGNLKRKNAGNKDGTFFEFIKSLQYAELYYFRLLKEGWKPEQARAVLPNSLKTELVMTGFVSDWQHFFDLRALGTTGAPHPQAKELAEPLMKEFIARKYINN